MKLAIFHALLTWLTFSLFGVTGLLACTSDGDLRAWPSRLSYPPSSSGSHARALLVYDSQVLAALFIAIHFFRGGNTMSLFTAN